MFFEFWKVEQDVLCVINSSKVMCNACNKEIPNATSASTTTVSIRFQNRKKGKNVVLCGMLVKRRHCPDAYIGRKTQQKGTVLPPNRQ